MNNKQQTHGNFLDNTSQDFDSIDKKKDLDNSQSFGYVAIVGAPNAGKSTLINQLMQGPALMGVHHKAHTTRQSLLGVMTHENTQIGLLDTVGLVNKPIQTLERRLHAKNLWLGASDCDLVIWLVSLTDYFSERHQSMIDLIKKYTGPKANLWIVFNKRDLVSDEKAFAFMEHFKVFDKQVQYFHTLSALKKKQIDKFREILCAAMPKRSWVYDPQCFSPASHATIAEQITREVVMDNLHDEIPYDVVIVTKEWSETSDSYTLRQELIVSRASRKGMIIGQKGQTIKRISQISRMKIHRALRLSKVLHFFLEVKVNDHNYQNHDRQSFVQNPLELQDFSFEQYFPSVPVIESSKDYSVIESFLKKAAQEIEKK